MNKTNPITKQLEEIEVKNWKVLPDDVEIKLEVGTVKELIYQSNIDLLKTIENEVEGMKKDCSLEAEAYKGNPQKFSDMGHNDAILDVLRLLRDKLKKGQ